MADLNEWKKKLTPENLKKAINEYKEKAKEFIKDEKKINDICQKAEKLLEKVPKVGNDLAEIPTLIQMLRSYYVKEYTDIPMTSIISIVGGLVYFISPLDIIPDSLPVVGWLDDAGVIYFILKAIRPDVEKYKAWQKQRGARA